MLLHTWADGSTVALLNIGARTSAATVKRRGIIAKSRPFLNATTARLLTRRRGRAF